MIKGLIKNALSSLNVPVSFQKYTGNASTYITFHEYFITGEEYSEDEETFTGHYVQVDLFSLTDYEELVNQILSIMNEAGFRRLDEIDLYENDTGLYHKGIRFFYLEER